MFRGVGDHPAEFFYAVISATCYTIDPNQKKKDAILKVLKHPTIVAVGIGLVMIPAWSLVLNLAFCG